jgi:hypothetical protein
MGMKPRVGGDRTIDGYIASLPPQRAAIVTALRDIVERAAPGATGSIKWAQPVFEDGGPICYIRSFAGHVNFGFWRGGEIEDHTGGRLEGGGDRMKHVKLKSLEDIDETAIADMVREAVELNRRRGDPTRRRSA